MSIRTNTAMRARIHSSWDDANPLISKGFVDHALITPSQTVGFVGHSDHGHPLMKHRFRSFPFLPGRHDVIVDGAHFGSGVLIFNECRFNSSVWNEKDDSRNGSTLLYAGARPNPLNLVDGRRRFFPRPGFLHDKH